jgi:endothelin-converting enzyme
LYNFLANKSHRDALFDPIGSYNPVPFSNLTAGLQQINFPNYLATFAPRVYPNRVIVTYPPYVTDLSSLLDSTEGEVIEAYLVTRVALSLSPLLGQETSAWKIVRELREVLAGLKKGAVPDRAEYCAKVVSDVMGYATGRFFVQKAFGGESKTRAGELISSKSSDSLWTASSSQ